MSQEGKKREIEFPEETLNVYQWPDPVVDQLGHGPRSEYVEMFWVPVIGPSSHLLHRTFVSALERSPDGVELVSKELAINLGLGVRGGKHGPFWRSIDRLARFGILHRTGSKLMVRQNLAPLNRHQVDRLAPHLRRAHDGWAEAQLSELRSTPSYRSSQLKRAS